MPYCETPEELAEALADQLGVYGPIPDSDHPDGCGCRICFISGLADRIRSAVRSEYQSEIRRLKSIVMLQHRSVQALLKEKERLGQALSADWQALRIQHLEERIVVLEQTLAQKSGKSEEEIRREYDISPF